MENLIVRKPIRPVPLERVNALATHEKRTFSRYTIQTKVIAWRRILESAVRGFVGFLFYITLAVVLDVILLSCNFVPVTQSPPLFRFLHMSTEFGHGAPLFIFFFIYSITWSLALLYYWPAQVTQFEGQTMEVMVALADDTVAMLRNVPLLGSIAPLNTDSVRHVLQTEKQKLTYRLEILYRVFPGFHSGLVNDNMNPVPVRERMALDKIPYDGFPNPDTTYRVPQQLYLVSCTSTKTSIFKGETIATTKLMVIDLETLKGCFHPIRTNLSLTYDDACNRVRKYASGQEARIVDDGLQSLSGFFSHQDTFEIWRKCVKHADFKFARPVNLKSSSPSQ